LTVPAPEAAGAPLSGVDSLAGPDSRAGVKNALLKSTLRLQSDGRLVELLRDGYTPAFDVMVERYKVPLTRYCMRMVGPDHADDVVQETFAASFTALGGDDRPIQLKPWLYRVAHNTAISVLRKKGRTDHEELDENFDGVRQPHEQFEQNQELHELVSRMRALPERQRTALVLQELEGLSPEEIADELDGTVPMVRQLVHRARERLRNGVGLLIPLPLLLRLFRADTAAAATGKSGAAAAATKPAGFALAGGAGATGSGAKLAVILAAGAIAGGGVAAEAQLGVVSAAWKGIVANESSKAAELSANVGGPAGAGGPTSSVVTGAGASGKPADVAAPGPAAGVDAPGAQSAPASEPAGGDAPAPQAADPAENSPSDTGSDRGSSPSDEPSGSDGPGGGSGGGSGGGGGGGDQPSSQPATGTAPSSGSAPAAGGSQPGGGTSSGGGSEPSGGGTPTGGGSQPSGGGTTPTTTPKKCSPLLPLLPICLKK
jgi:RNA polymerase sigma factor (sigma-70 family)